jgi:creatinine amidohydrolase
MKPKYAIAEMTHAEFAERVRRPAVILIPLGSQEEQGPHAPMGDFMLTARLAELSAEAGQGLAAPVLPFGYADFFRSIAGGMQLRPQTFTAVLEDMLAAFLDHGLERLLIFNGHTTNASLIDQVVRRVRRERGVAIPSLNIWKCIPDTLWSELYGADAQRVRGHGGEPISSVNAYLFPQLQRPDLVVSASRNGRAFGLPLDGVSQARFEGLPLQLPVDCHEVDPNGMLGGSADGANAARGKAICEHIVGHSGRLMQHLLTCDPRAMVPTSGGVHDGKVPH